VALAGRHYNRQVLKRCFKLKLRPILSKLRQQELRADEFRARQLKVEWFDSLLHASQLLALERRQNEVHLELVAVRHRIAVVAKTTFEALRENVEISKTETVFCRRKVLVALHKWHFQKWRESVVDLRQEKRLAEVQEAAFVRTYRARRYGQLFFAALQQNREEAQTEREKSAFKQQMWSKVNDWLGNLDKEKKLE